MLNVKKLGIILGLLFCNVSLSAISPEQELEIFQAVNGLVATRFRGGPYYTGTSGSTFCKNDFYALLPNFAKCESKRWANLIAFLQAMRGIDDVKTLTPQALDQLKRLDGSVGFTFAKALEMLSYQNDRAGDLFLNGSFIKTDFLFGFSDYLSGIRDVKALNDFLMHKFPVIRGLGLFICYSSDVQTIDSAIVVLSRIRNAINNTCKKLGWDKSFAEAELGEIINLLEAKSSVTSCVIRGLKRALPVALGLGAAVGCAYLCIYASGASSKMVSNSNVDLGVFCPEGLDYCSMWA